MYEATRIEIGVEGRASRSPKRTMRVIGAAVCCMAVLACVAVGFPGHNSSDAFGFLRLNSRYSTSPADELLQVSGKVPVAATVRDFLSSPSSGPAAKHVEQVQPAKDSGATESAHILSKQAAQLHMLEQIAHSVKAQVAKLRGEKGQGTKLAFKPDETAARADAIVAEAKKRYSELHKPMKAASSGASESSRSGASASSRSAALSGLKSSASHSSGATANLDDLNAMAAKADDAAASAIDDADEQRVVVARRASSYLKAEKRALIVQEKAELAEAKADKARALVEDAAAKNAAAHARMFRKRSARAVAKATKYAEQIETMISY